MAAHWFWKNQVSRRREQNILRSRLRVLPSGAFSGICGFFNVQTPIKTGGEGEPEASRTRQSRFIG